MEDLNLFNSLSTSVIPKVTNVLWDFHLKEVKEQHPGIWCEEPDYVQWFMPEENIVCVLWRHPTYGHWCGYLGLPTSLNDEVEDLPFHGGLTYRRATLTAYQPQEGEPEIEEWVGFDCGHAFDLEPFQDYSDAISTYRDIGYVVQNLLEVAQLINRDYAKTT